MEENLHSPVTIAVLSHLKIIRPVLLDLHRALLAVERAHYEQQNGPIASNGEFLQLVLEDQWFSWLRPISQFIVKIDEVIWAKDPLQWNQAESLFAEAKQMFPPATEHNNLPFKRYGLMVEQNGDVATLHQRLHTLFSELEPSG
jgi:hypothetical protein